MSIVRRELEQWLSTIDVEGRTLDIGGRVWSMQHKVKSFKGTWQPFDESDGDLNNMNDMTSLSLKYYDNIFCTEVMQFVYNPYSVLSDLNSALKKEGKFYISFHLMHPPMKGHDYLRYTEKGVRRLLEVTNFKIEELVEPLPGFYLVKACKNSQS